MDKEQLGNILKDHMATFCSEDGSFKTSPKAIEAVQSSLAEALDIMQETVQKSLSRCEALDSVMVKSDELAKVRIR